MDRQFSVTVTEEIYESCAEGTAGRILAKVLGFSRKEISRLKFQGEILLNGRKIHVNEHVPIGETLLVRFRETPVQQGASPAVIPEILYEDEDLAVVNKPAGMPVHASHGHLDDSLGDALRAYYLSQGRNFAVRTVGRLDKDVSGAVLFAKNQPASARLWSMRHEGILKKEYTALISGSFAEEEGEIILPLKKEEGIRRRQTDENGKPCMTHWRQIRTFQYEEKVISLLKVEIVTGRTHQIRAHMSTSGHPLLGDELYGGDCTLIGRPALHCSDVRGISPFTRKEFHAEAALSRDMEQILRRLNYE